jgi:heme o synthase
VKSYFVLTKIGITIFVIIAGILGYLLGHKTQSPVEFSKLINLILGLYFLSGSSFIFNQIQERHIDCQMQRTRLRPIACFEISALKAWKLGTVFFILGIVFLFLASWMSCLLGLISVLTYNVLYTPIWKPKWVFGAVPGAIPGALPVLIGFAAGNEAIWSKEAVYIFTVLFLWQMPHFWTLAIKLRDDYRNAGIPTLPAERDIPSTQYYIGLYLFAYVGVVLTAPFFVKTYLFYIVAVLPISLKLIVEFIRFYRNFNEGSWLRFFMWVNMSVIFFLVAPAFDKWYLYFYGN